MWLWTVWTYCLSIFLSFLGQPHWNSWYIGQVSKQGSPTEAGMSASTAQRLVRVFCTMKPCSLIAGYLHFSETCLHLQGWSQSSQESGCLYRNVWVESGQGRFSLIEPVAFVPWLTCTLIVEFVCFWGIWMGFIQLLKLMKRWI